MRCLFADGDLGQQLNSVHDMVFHINAPNRRCTSDGNHDQNPETQPQTSCTSRSLRDFLENINSSQGYARPLDKVDALSSGAALWMRGRRSTAGWGRMSARMSAKHRPGPSACTWCRAPSDGNSIVFYTNISGASRDRNPPRGMERLHPGWHIGQGGNANTSIVGDRARHSALAHAERYVSPKPAHT